MNEMLNEIIGISLILNISILLMTTIININITKKDKEDK